MREYILEGRSCEEETGKPCVIERKREPRETIGCVPSDHIIGGKTGRIGSFHAGTRTVALVCQSGAEQVADAH